MFNKNILLIDIGGSKIRAKYLRMISTFDKTKEKKIAIKDKNMLENALVGLKQELKLSTKLETIGVGIAGDVNHNLVTHKGMGLVKYDLAVKLKEIFQCNQVIMLNDSVAASQALPLNKSIIFASTGIGSAINHHNTELGHRTHITKENALNTVKYTQSDQTSNLEVIASGKGITSLQQKNIRTAKKLAIDAKKGDIGAENTLMQAGRYLGYAIASYHEHNLTKNLVDSSHIYIIDGSLGTNKIYFEGIKTGLKEYQVFHKNQNIKQSLIQSANTKNSSELIFKGLTKKLIK